MLYPLISSTMAQCTMKLTYSCSTPVSLQTACLAVLSPLQKAYLSKAFPSLRYLSENVFADILRKPIGNSSNKSWFLFFINVNNIKFCITEHDNEEDIEFPAEYIILDDFDYALVGNGVKKKKKH